MPLEGLAELNAVLDRARDQLPREVRTLQGKVTLDLLRGFAKRTKAVSGRARGNWQVTAGEPAEGEVGAEKSVAVVVARGASALKGLQNYDVAWITNNAPYINKLDHGFISRRGRVKAPRGIVAATLAEVGDKLGD